MGAGSRRITRCPSGRAGLPRLAGEPRRDRSAQRARRPAPNGKRARQLPAFRQRLVPGRITLSMDCVAMSVSMRPSGAKPGVSVRLARRKMKTRVSGHRTRDGCRIRQTRERQGNCRFTRKLDVPATLPGRDSGVFAGGPSSYGPEKENFHVRLSGNPAILGFRPSFRPVTLRPHLSMSLPCFRIRFFDYCYCGARRAHKSQLV